ncbi:MAG: hypothetical protein AB1721_02750 [Patescibacteria group bacterium]
MKTKQILIAFFILTAFSLVPFSVEAKKGGKTVEEAIALKRAEKLNKQRERELRLQWKAEYFQTKRAYQNQEKALCNKESDFKQNKERCQELAKINNFLGHGAERMEEIRNRVNTLSEKANAYAKQEIMGKDNWGNWYYNAQKDVGRYVPFDGSAQNYPPHGANVYWMQTSWWKNR